MFSYAERYHGQTSTFIDEEQKHNTKVYKIISSFLIWVAPKPLPIKVVNALVLGLYYSWNNSSNEQFLRKKNTKKISAEQKPLGRMTSIMKGQQ